MRHPLVLVAVLLMGFTALAETDFPLPSVDGKPAIRAGERTFKVPLGFAAVERFYRAHFKGKNVAVTRTQDAAGVRMLRIVSREKSSRWARVTVREGTVDTRIEVTPVVRLDDVHVEGSGVPAVQFVIGRSPEAARAAAEIDHTER